MKGTGAEALLGAVKSIAKVASTVLVGLAVVLAVALVGVRIFGLDVYTVLSGSMEPTYKTGSVIWVADREPADIEVGDPITFVLNEDLVVATHRVIEIDTENQHFYTQGDANDAPDGSPVHFENLIGEPVFTVPYLGYLVSYVQAPPGCYVAIAACAFLLMLMFLPDLLSKDEGERARAESERRERAAARDRRARRAGAPSSHDARRPQARGTQIPRGPRPAAGAVQVPRGRQVAGASAQRRQAGQVPQQRATGERQDGRAQAAPTPAGTQAAAAAQANNPRLRQQSYRQRLADEQAAGTGQ